MMQKLAAGVVLALLTATSAQAVSVAAEAALSCRATHTINCLDGEACVRSPDEFIPITVDYDPAARSGDLCTYTYCRSFEMVAAPSAPNQSRDALTGFTFSADSGSTDEYRGVPVVDFQLSFNEARSRFVLVNVANGGVSGWGGVCGADAP